MKQRSDSKLFTDISDCMEFSDYGLYEVDFDKLWAVIEKYEDETATLKAKLWVAKDSALRTYDGLAQKADKADSYKMILEMIAYNEAPVENTGLCSRNLAKSVLEGAE